MAGPGGGDEFALLEDNAAEAGLTWAGRPPVVRRRVDVGGRAVSAIAWGEAPPELVLLHGSAQNAHTWDTVALALGRPLLAVDLPGHGHSDWRTDHDYRLDNLSADVAAVIGELAPDARAVVGMSLGGLTALTVAATRPDLVRRLILVDITPGVDAAKAQAITDFVSGPERFATFEEMVDRTVAHHAGRSEASLRRGVTHNARENEDGTWTWRWDPVRRSGVDAGELAGLWEVISTLDAPLTLVRGSASPVVDDDDVAQLTRRAPGAEIVVVDGAGHSIQGDRPIALADAISRSLIREPR